MSIQDRADLVRFCYDSAEEFCCEVEIPFEELDDEDLIREFGWYDHLWNK